MKNSSLIFLFFWIFSTPLIIAQTPQWANSTIGAGTTSHDANHVHMDQDGNIYVAGNFMYALHFSDSDLEFTGVGGTNAYIYKRSASGELLWARVYGGALVNNLLDMTIDNDGNIYLVGQFRGDMAVGSGGNSISLSANGMGAGYVVKYSPAGALLGAHTVGGTARDDFNAITFDGDNNIILAGNFTGEVDFDLSQNSHIEHCTGLTFVKYTENFELISVHTLHSPPYIYITNLSVNADDELIFGGYFREYVTLDSGEGITGCTENTYCGFVMKLSSNYEFEWVAGITGTSGQQVLDMAVMDSGSIYIAGEFSNTADFISNDETQTFETNSGSRDVFFAKISTSGNFEWIKTMGGPGNDFVSGLDLDTDGNIFLAGSYKQTMDFNPGSGTAEYTSEASSSTYVSIYTPDGEYANTFTYDNPSISNPGYLGGNAASGIALNADNDIYLTGWFKTSINFDPSQSGFEFTSMGQDCYLLKMSSVIVGLEQARGAYPISIFPNPARDEVHIEAPNIQKIEVYTIHGKLVLSKSIKGFGDRHTMNISHLPAGTYILSLTANGEKPRTEKLVIVR